MYQGISQYSGKSCAGSLKGIKIAKDQTAYTTDIAKRKENIFFVKYVIKEKRREEERGLELKEKVIKVKKFRANDE